jgi:3-methyladenine DNA glycosylase AlkD
MATKPKPAELAKETIAALSALADQKKAAAYQRYFKEPVAMFGVDSNLSKELREDLLKRVRGAWSLADSVAFCKAMLRDPHLESRGTGFQIVAGFLKEAGADLLPEIRLWLEKSCGNWGLVDNLSITVTGPLLQAHPELAAEVMTWADSDNQWVRRGAVVGLIPSARKGRLLDESYAIALRLAGDKEDLMHKATGWMLREAGKTDMDRLERFLLKDGARLPRTTLRYAIERFPAPKRKVLMEATRG